MEVLNEWVQAAKQVSHWRVFVLSRFFHNVCELDLVFNFYKVTSATFWWWGEGKTCFVKGLFGRGRNVSRRRDSRDESNQSVETVDDVNLAWMRPPFFVSLFIIRFRQRHSNPRPSSCLATEFFLTLSLSTLVWSSCAIDDVLVLS